MNIVHQEYVLQQFNQIDCIDALKNVFLNLKLHRIFIFILMYNFDV